MNRKRTSPKNLRPRVFSKSPEEEATSAARTGIPIEMSRKNEPKIKREERDIVSFKELSLLGPIIHKKRPGSKLGRGLFCSKEGYWATTRTAEKAGMVKRTVEPAAGIGPES